ncbi:nucleotidyltransferase [uncultured Erythrobacter sp.]|uniref:nucleotidyltransferase domain-containing protein n=1 Tax=uncultured Erythrobacter sp. TaxID=263913 RepID=UPI002626AF41|nr:nucleotidyltransferase [uncultured Erythrobacter sp.]
MPDKPPPSHEDALQALARAIDMPDDKAEEARAHFKSLGEWLERNDSSIAQYDPYIAPQGSFLLGTANRPVGKDEDYDVDLICRLQSDKGTFTQKSLKAAVGREVIAYAKAHSMAHEPEDKRRCWTLEYADGSQFHMDVLPCIPDAQEYQSRLRKAGFVELANDATKTLDAVAITDKTEPNFDRYCEDWPCSNPLGYAAWFRDIMAVSIHLRKAELAAKDSTFAKVEDIPDHAVKTTLQKAIQLLKRHRDTMFAEDMDVRPISIIITTLAAKSYDNEDTLVGALTAILTNMDAHIETRSDGKWIPNPVNPAENFADRWAEDRRLEHSFDRWLAAARSDFGLFINASRPTEVPTVLAERLGDRTVETAMTAIGAVGAVVTTAAPVAARVKEAVEEVKSTRSGTSPYYRI